MKPLIKSIVSLVFPSTQNRSAVLSTPGLARRRGTTRTVIPARIWVKTATRPSVTAISPGNQVYPLYADLRRNVTRIYMYPMRRLSRETTYSLFSWVNQNVLGLYLELSTIADIECLSIRQQDT
jgi:hypothetical protein